MRVTSKGQVTIPKDIRTALGIGPGSEVRFVMDGDSAKLYSSEAVAGESRGERAVRVLRELGQRHKPDDRFASMTADEYMAFIRGRRDDLDLD